MDFDLYDPSPKLRPIKRVPGTKVTPPIVNITDRFILNKKQQKYEHFFAPIINIEGYIRDAKLTGEKADEYRRLYTPTPDPPKDVREKINVPSNPLYVFSNMKVLKNGTVRIKFTVPMEPVYEIMKTGHMPPIEVRIKAAKGFGYPDYVLENMIKKHDYLKNNSDELDEFIEVIFGKCLTSKTSKPKAKSIQETLNSKLKKKPEKKG